MPVSPRQRHIEESGSYGRRKIERPCSVRAVGRSYSYEAPAPKGECGIGISSGSRPAHDAVLTEHLGSTLRGVVYHFAHSIDPSWQVVEGVERADFGIDLHLSTGILGFGWQIVEDDLRLWCQPRSVDELLLDHLALDVTELSHDWAALIGSSLASLELSPPGAMKCSATVTFGDRTVRIAAAELRPGTMEVRACSDEIMVWFGGHPRG